MTVLQLPRLSITALTEADLQSASRLLHDSWHDLYSNILPVLLTDQKTHAHFDDYLRGKQGLCWIARLGEKTVGLVTTSSNCIEELWVEKKYQRRNIGERLMNTALVHLRTKGFGHAQTGFESFNAAATAFFESHNWRCIGSEHIQLQPGKNVKALVYSTRL